MTSEWKKTPNTYISSIKYPAGSKFSSFSLYLLPFSRYWPTSCLQVTWSRNGKIPPNTHNSDLKYHASPKFLSFSLYILPFSRYWPTSCLRVTWPRNSKIPPNTYISSIKYPAGLKFSSFSLYLLPFSKYIYFFNKVPCGFQIFVLFTLSLTVFEILTHFLFAGHMTSEQ